MQRAQSNSPQKQHQRRTSSRLLAPRRKTLADLKRLIDALANVASSADRKRTNGHLCHLDVRQRASRLSALELLRQAAATDPDWDRNLQEE